jgi:hypothetical protein
MRLRDKLADCKKTTPVMFTGESSKAGFEAPTPIKAIQRP